MSTTTYQAITEALSEIKANQLNEDGHTDVPSSMRMCMTIMEDAHDILCALKNTEMDEEIDTWWTNKLAVSASTLNKLRDYYVHEVDHQKQPDEADMEIEEAKTDKAMGGSAGMGAPVKRGTARDVGIATGVLGGLGASALTNAHIRRRTGMQEAKTDKAMGGSAGMGAPVKRPPARGTGPATHNTPEGGTSNVNPFRGFPVGKALRQGSAAALGTGAAASEVYLMNLVSKANKNPKRRSGIQEEAIEENALTDFARGVGRQLMHRGGPDTKPSISTMGQLQGLGGPYLQKPLQRFLYPRKRGMAPAARRQGKN